MIVKIGDKFYDSEKEPIMIILSDFDKVYIGNMDPKTFRYCSYPKEIDFKKISKWMLKD